MIINLRGTSGSGKSTLVRVLMSRYQEQKPIYIPGRKRPYGYECLRAGGRPLWVLGHYETACGGGDTIPSLDDVYASVRERAVSGFDAVYEGLIIQSDINRCVSLSREHDLKVVVLDVPIAVCIASVEARRVARGDLRPLNPKNTIAKAKTVPAQLRRLLAAGVDAVLVNRADAEAICIGALGLPREIVCAEPEPVFQLS